MTQTLIHVGYHKTGTTWLKNHFFPYVKNADIIYYNDLAFGLAPGKEYFEIIPGKLVAEKDFRILTAHILTGFVNGRWENGAYRKFFTTHLKSYFPDAHIILFIRNQLDLFTSFYSAYLTKGGTCKIEELYSDKHLAGGGFFSFEYYNFPEMVQFYQDSFGKDNVHVFVFEEFLEDNQGFLQKFVNKFGFDIDIGKLNYTKSNEKLRKGLASFIRNINMLTAKGPHPKKHIVDLPWIYSLITKERLNKINQYSIWGKKIYRNDMLGESLVNKINEYYKKSNNQLTNEFGIESIKKYGYPL